MNSKEREAILKSNGYRYLAKREGINRLCRWQAPTGKIVARSESKSNATYAAYQHFIDAQAGQSKEAAESEVVVSSYLDKPFPRFMVGQVVEVAGHIGAITAIRQLTDANQTFNEYTFENSFPSNAWFAESELTENVPSEVESLHNRIAALKQLNDELLAHIDMMQTSNLGLQAQLEASKAKVVQKSHSLLQQIEANVTLRKENERYVTALQGIQSAISRDYAVQLATNALELQAKIEASVEAPEVTLSNSELDWLARSSTEHEYFVNAVGAHSMTGHLQGYVLRSLDNDSIFGRWVLTDNYNTPANLAAIESKRAALAEKA